MRAKLFRVLDRATELECFGLQMWVDLEEEIKGVSVPFDGEGPDLSSLVREAQILRRGGYGGVKCILFGNVVGGSCWYDPYMWADRTYQTAHAYIRDHWAELNSGDTIDVEVILGEKDGKAEDTQR